MLAQLGALHRRVSAEEDGDADSVTDAGTGCVAVLARMAGADGCYGNDARSRGVSNADDGQACESAAARGLFAVGILGGGHG